MARSLPFVAVRRPERRRRSAIAFCVFGCGLLSSWAAPAAAQDVGNNFVGSALPVAPTNSQNISVADRSRPDYEPIGIALGGFDLYPKIEAAVGYTDNVYQVNQPRNSDAYFGISPSVRLLSHWSANAIRLEAGGDFRRYADQTRRNQDGWHVDASGLYDLNGTRLTGEAQTVRATEAATSASYPTDAADAVQYRQTLGRIDIAHDFGLLTGDVQYAFTRYTFGNVRSFQGDVIDQGFRDSSNHELMSRLSYSVTPSSAAFIQSSYDWTRYSQQISAGVPNRDSDTYRVLAGLSFDISALFRGSVAAGYQRRSYQANLYRSIAGFTAEARLEYFPSQITTVTVSAKRVIEDATFLNSGGYLNNSVALRVDHELFRSLILNAQMGYERDKYVGSPASLGLWRVSGGARYMLGHDLGFGLLASHDSRNAYGALRGSNYGENRVQLSVIVQR